MKVEKVLSPLAEDWMHIRRITAREWADCAKVSGESTVDNAIRFVAICLCHATGSSEWKDRDKAIEAAGALDWELVCDIERQASKFNGFNVKVDDAEKNS